MTNSVVFALTLLSAGFTAATCVSTCVSVLQAVPDADSGVRRLNGMFLLVYLAVAVLCLVGCGAMVLNVHALFSGGLTAQEINLARALLMIMGVNIAVTMLSTPFDSYIVAHERFVFQQSRQLFTALAQPFLAVLLLWLGMGVGVACAQLDDFDHTSRMEYQLFCHAQVEHAIYIPRSGMVSIQKLWQFSVFDFPESDFRFGQQSAASSSSPNPHTYFSDVHHFSTPPGEVLEPVGLRSGQKQKSDRVDAGRFPR